jgi:hypothetical protein
LLKSITLADHFMCFVLMLMMHSAIEVYERGVRVMPYCVDLWTYFATHVAERSDDLDYIRSVFERAVTVS